MNDTNHDDVLDRAESQNLREAPEIAVLRLPHFGELNLPSYKTLGAAGMDLVAAIDDDAPIALAPGARTLIPTGLAMALPEGYEAQIRPRSGLALSHGVTCLNSPGTIDADYRGEVQVLLVNHGDKPFTIRRGDRIAQMIVARVAQAEWLDVDDLPATPRGGGGFGSTGV